MHNFHNRSLRTETQLNMAESSTKHLRPHYYFGPAAQVTSALTADYSWITAGKFTAYSWIITR
jgi:hypothetical protein